MEPQQPINLDAEIKIPNYVFSEKIDNAFFILNSNDGQYYELEGTSSDIWEIINQKNTTITSLIKQLEGVYLEHPDIKNQVIEFINELLKKSVLEISS